MPPKSKKPKTILEDLEWTGSQDNDGSDDGQQAYLELFMKIEADKAKKKRQQELQLLTTSRKNLDSCLVEGAKSMNEVYFNLQHEIKGMLTEYAEIDDSIRKLWVALMEEQKTYVALCEAQDGEFDKIREERDEGHDSALRSMKSACQEQSRAIEHISGPFP
ncbi:uncharacterized protein EI90DRAFT_1832071 [Cantharellus anzutake]|uniref:uncharacterized protein n=1 Tax=Cantharellus anzutake TaxID=1750568 RepID=UPI001906A282|nr:uncharacterized protein EI90DRAFT_1832071 [Cantharellus anzutake]KAF8327224.1 hypothetical protein EI90DRAFT_1832071 [Cantharellus anzutake]